MKGLALSVRQPWASLLVWGLKTIEIRSWSTNYRGHLLIHAAKKVDEKAMKRFQINNPLVGALIGTVELIKIEQFTESMWNDLGDLHLDIGSFPAGMYAWYMTNPKPLEKPLLYKGDRGLFPVKIDNDF